MFRSMTHGGLLTFLPLYLATELGYSPIWIGACMAALQAAGFIACPIAGHLSDRMGRRQIVMSSMAVTAVIIVAMIVKRLIGTPASRPSERSGRIGSGV